MSSCATWAGSAIIDSFEPGPEAAEESNKTIKNKVYVFQCSLRLEVGLLPVAPNATTSTSRLNVKVASARRNDHWDLLLVP